MINLKSISISALICCFLFLQTSAQVSKSPPRSEGDGPWNQLILRGATIINGNGSPPIGPIDIVVENNRIVDIVNVGYPDIPIDPKRRPKLKPDGHELDCAGMYVLPGFVDMHGHIGGKMQGAGAEYVFKLWMGHGITTVRDPGSGNGLDWVLEHKAKSAENSITAPRLLAYKRFGKKWNGDPVSTPEEAREWVRENARRGADGIKFGGSAPDLMTAALDENKKLGLRSACHHAQLYVGRWNVLNSARAGLTTMEHWYGLPEALFDDKIVQHYPLDYNYSNEQNRFEEAGKLWKQSAPQGSKKWNEVMGELLDLKFAIVPTFNIYEASRDLHRARRAEWHEIYTLPSLWRFYAPSKISHGSYWHYWGTEQEVAWRENFRIWMSFINEFKNKGGLVAAGSDSGFIYQLYGFGYIRELELLREAGFHPLEVIMAATLNGAIALGMDDEIGTIEVGKLADFVVIEENPLINLKVLYGTGAIKLMDDNEVKRVGGVKYTIKDGIIYDAKKLLEDVAEMTSKAKKEENFKIIQPGMKIIKP